VLFREDAAPVFDRVDRVFTYVAEVVGVAASLRLMHILEADDRSGRRS
jgi:hypothetical protein